MEFIYLKKGNWFELSIFNPNKNSHQYDLFDIQTLQEEVLNHILTSSEKLSIINVSYGKKYQKSEIIDITMSLRPDRFDIIKEFLQTEKRHPIVTFHGTTKFDVVQKIMEEGYIIAGKSSKVKVIHGSAYGTGVYSTPHIDKALQYTHIDNDHVYVLINFVLLGNVIMIGDTGNTDDKLADTKIVYGLDQIISKKRERIIPMGYLTLRVK